MLGFLDRFLTRRSALGSQGGVTRKQQPHDGLLACPRASVVPGAIVRSRARRALGISADTGRHAPAARAHSPARAFWISVDPQDTRRTVMSGTPKEVCEVLDELLAMQEFSAPTPRG
jgi:hypothetical protein